MKPRPATRGPYKPRTPGKVGRTAKYHIPVPPKLANPDVEHSYVSVRDQQLKRLRALAIIKDKIEGMTIADLQAKYRMGSETIKRAMSWAKRANLLVDAEDQVLQEFVPQAGLVLMEAMQSRATAGGRKSRKGAAPGDDDDEGLEVDLGPSEAAVKIALEVYKGTGIFRKPNQKSPSNPIGETGDELAKHIQAMRAKAALDEATHDGELIERRYPAGLLTTDLGHHDGLTSGEEAPGGPVPDGADGEVAEEAGPGVRPSDPEVGDSEP